MALLDKLDKKFRNWGIPHITLHLVFGQSLVFLLMLTAHANIRTLALIPARVLQGEVWRLFTFLFIPPTRNAIFIIFALYLFYLMGTALESYWGTFRYNIFLLIAYLATVGASFLTPYAPSSNAYIGGSVFLAFALLNPDFELALFFILPVKIKWLALLTWGWYFIQFVFGSWTSRLLILASVLNILVFFGKDMYLMMRSRRWRMERKAREFAARNEPTHRCTVCGVTDKDDPDMTFRYCTKCAGTPCYCREHINNHEHITADNPEGATDKSPR
jgi:hypothetical protein